MELLDTLRGQASRLAGEIAQKERELKELKHQHKAVTRAIETIEKGAGDNATND